MEGCQVFKLFEEKQYIHEKDFDVLVSYICGILILIFHQIVGNFITCIITIRNFVSSKIGKKNLHPNGEK